ncbi:MAG TPA: hypothetical protein VF796_22615, partial [Humisphaera sp.]
RLAGMPPAEQVECLALFDRADRLAGAASTRPSTRPAIVPARPGLSPGRRDAAPVGRQYRHPFRQPRDGPRPSRRPAASRARATPGPGVVAAAQEAGRDDPSAAGAVGFSTTVASARSSSGSRRAALNAITACVTLVPANSTYAPPTDPPLLEIGPGPRGRGGGDEA